MIFDQSANAIQQRKDIVFTNCSGKTGHSHEKNETGPLLNTIHKNLDEKVIYRGKLYIYNYIYITIYSYI